MNQPSVRPTRAMLWLGALLLIGLALAASGSGTLEPPPADPAAWSAWAEARSGPALVLSLARLIGLGVVAHLAMSTGLILAGSIVRGPALVRTAVRATLPGLRPLLTGATGVGLALTSSSLPALARADDPGPQGRDRAPGAPVAVWTVDGEAADGAQDDDLLTLVDPGPPTTADGHPRLGPRPDGGRPGPSVPTPAAPVPLAPGEAVPLDGHHAAGLEADAPGAGAAMSQTGDGSAWTIVPGDHLWHVAEATLTSAWGRAPDDGQVARYWRALIDANRSRLVDPDHPDLVLPGQVFSLPPPPPIPA